MNFEAKILDITANIKIKIESKQLFLKRVTEMEEIIKIGFHAVKLKKFALEIIQIRDIRQTLCKFIKDNEPSKRDLLIFDAYIKQLTVYKLDTNYILGNYHLLQFDNNCGTDTSIIVNQ